MRRLILFAVLSLPAAEGRSADWPEIMGPGRRGISLETGWHTDWNAREPAVAWKAQVGTGASSCAVVGGKLYTTGTARGEETVWCLDAATGKEIWRQRYECVPDTSLWEGGAAATPVVEAGRVFTLSFRGDLNCWDAADGRKLWGLRMEQDLGGKMSKFGWVGSPLIAGDALIVQPGAPGAGQAAVEKATGKRLWRSGDDAPACSSPVRFTGPNLSGVAIFNAGGFTGIDPANGRALFHYPWKTDFDVNAIIPVHHDGHFFLSSAYGRGMALVSPALSARAPAPGSPEASSPGGGVLWKHPLSLHFQSPVLYEDHLYFVSGEADKAAVLHCMTWKTGAIRWAETIGRERGHLIIAGKHLLVITQDGELVLAEASPEGFQEKGRLQAMPKRTFTVPAFSEGRLYLRNNKGMLVCLNLRP